MISLSTADAETKAYLANAEHFADLFNYWIYNGDEVIKPEDLSELDTASIALPYGNETLQPVQKFRDILKLYSAMQDGRAIYLILGIEAQSHINYAMPVRNMLYDAMNYAGQVKAVTNARRKAGTKMTSDEFLSGFCKDDHIMPVITLVVSFSSQPWDGSMSLHEMLGVTDERLLAFVPDYRLNLLSPERIDEPDFAKFRTGLGAVMQFIKHQQDESMDWIAGVKRFEAVDRETASLIKTTTGTDISFDEEGEMINMCKAWDNSMQQAENRGKDTERINSIRKMMQKLNLTAKQAMDVLDIPAAEQPKYVAQV